jgi:hypothetical protein
MTYTVVSPDLVVDLVVNVADLSFFAGVYVGAYNPCCDYNCDGIVNIQDFAIFAVHYQHTCNP